MEIRLYRSLEEVKVEHHHWINKGQRMLVRIDSQDLAVDRFVHEFYEVQLSTWVVAIGSTGRFGKEEGKVLMHSTGRPFSGWDSEESFIDCARRAWFMENQHPDTQKRLRERSDEIRERCRQLGAAKAVRSMPIDESNSPLTH